MKTRPMTRDEMKDLDINIEDVCIHCNEPIFDTNIEWVALVWEKYESWDGTQEMIQEEPCCEASPTGFHTWVTA